MLVAVVVFLALADRYQGSLCETLLENEDGEEETRWALWQGL